VQLIQGRFALALGFSTAAHAGLAWMVDDHLAISASPAQRALTVAITPAAPRAVLNSIAPSTAATLSPAVVRPLAPPVVEAIHEPDRLVAGRPAEVVENREASLIEARGPELELQARDRESNIVAVAASKQMRLSSALHRQSAKKPLPARLQPMPGARPSALAIDRPLEHGKAAVATQQAASRTVTGQPGANREALPASGNDPPEYPWMARARGQQGRVVLSVWVSAEGAAERLAVSTSSGYSALDQAALDAVQHWRFQAARRGGLATESLVHVPVVFRLDGG
jgi:protein TonB